jgi:hypothetical protein
MDWVERRHKAEECLEKAVDGLWRDIRQAFEDACKSFRDCYGGVATVINMEAPNFRLRIHCQMLNSTPVLETDVDLAFDRASTSLLITYTRQFGHAPDSRSYRLDANVESAFITKERKQEHLTADELSCECLEPVFFKNSGPTSGWKEGRLI